MKSYKKGKNLPGMIEKISKKNPTSEFLFQKHFERSEVS